MDWDTLLKQATRYATEMELQGHWPEDEEQDDEDAD